MKCYGLRWKGFPTLGLENYKVAGLMIQSWLCAMIMISRKMSITSTDIQLPLHLSLTFIEQESCIC